MTEDGKDFELKKVVRKSPTLGAKAPRGAVVLFDGSNAEGWEATSRAGGFKGFLVDDKEGKVLYQGSVSKKTFRDVRLHVEFRHPYAPGRWASIAGTADSTYRIATRSRSWIRLAWKGVKNAARSMASRPPRSTCACHPCRG